MKKAYESAEFEVIKYNEADVLCDSKGMKTQNGAADGGTGNWSEIWKPNNN
jgi:hypothetical protein